VSDRVDESEVTRTLTAEQSPPPSPAKAAGTPTRPVTGKTSLHALPTGHRLQEFMIESTIGEGGFGVVYLARDTELDRVVAIKEFLPGAFAGRTEDFGVSVRSEQYRTSFEAGRRSFINEARLLARFEHPALVKVYRYWEENGTAYIAMPYYAGLTLKDWMHARQDKVSEGRLLRLVDALCDPLEMLHANGVFHRDVAPDNVRILENGQPVLLDLGAARKIMGDMTQTLTAFIKAGYAPIEQYADTATLRQGPWSDVYALSATLYYCVAGRAPPASVARMVKDECVAAAKLGTARYSARFLTAIDRGLAVRPEQRTRSIAEFRLDLGIRRPSLRPLAALQGQGSPAGEAGPLAAASDVRAAGPAPRIREAASRPRIGLLAIAIGTVVLAFLAATRFYKESTRETHVAAVPATSVPAAPTPVQPAAAPPSAAVLQAQDAISKAGARIAHVKQVIGVQRGASPTLFAASDAALDDARLKLASGQAQEAAEIAQAAADDAARSARGYVLGREIAYRQAADQRLKSDDIPGAESALNEAKAMRALGKRI
jgi:hypothetical protein